MKYLAQNFVTLLRNLDSTPAHQHTSTLIGNFLLIFLISSVFTIAGYSQTVPLESSGVTFGNPTPANVYIPFSNDYGVNDRAATIEVVFEDLTPAPSGWTAQREDAVRAAAADWGMILTSPFVIKVKAHFVESGFFPSNGITLTRATAFTQTLPGLVSGTDYPTSLASKLVDMNVLPQFATADMHIYFNKSTNWFSGTPSTCPDNAYDLRTAALKTIAQGLGLGRVLVPNVPMKPVVYDRFVKKGDQFFATLAPFDFQTPTSPTIVFATSPTGEVKWSGANALNAILNTPPVYSYFTSIYTLDENTYPYSGIPNNSLMTPMLNAKEEIHDPGPIAVGMLRDIGWMVDYPVGFGDELKIRGFNWQAHQNYNNGWSDTYFNTPIVNAKIGDRLSYAYQFIDNEPIHPLAPGTSSWKLEIQHNGGWYEHASVGSTNSNFNGKFFDFVLNDLLTFRRSKILK